MIDPIRVLVVYPHLPHYRYGVFAAMQKTEGINYTFASDIGSYKGIAVIPPTMLGRHIRLRNFCIKRLLWQRGLMRHIVSRRYDAYILYGDVTHLSTWTAAAVLRIRKRSVLFWTIGWHRREMGLKRLIRLRFYKLANRLLLYGNVGLSLGSATGYPDSRMSVIYNSHNSPWQTAVEAEDAESFIQQLDLAGPVVGAVIRLTPVKNLHLLVLAAAELKRRGEAVSLILVGEGPCRNMLENLARVHDVELHLPGAAYGDANMAAVYEHLDVTVVPSAVGLTAIQSMAYGTPVISDDDVFSQMPEWEAIRPSRTGLVYPTADVDALADAISEMLVVLDANHGVIRKACIEEVARNWNPGNQADLIAAAIYRESNT